MIQFSNNDVDKMKNLLSSIDFTINAVGQDNEVLIDRVALGLLIRELGSEWPMNLLFALSNELISVFEDKDQVKVINNKYTKFVERIYQLKLENVYSEKHILNGKDIQSLLNIKPGPVIKEVSNSIMEWQLKYPNNSKEECQEFIKHKYGKT